MAGSSWEARQLSAGVAGGGCRAHMALLHRSQNRQSTIFLQHRFTSPISSHTSQLQDIFSLRNNRDLHAPDFLLFFVIIDWVLAILMFSGFCASASVTIFFMKDMNFCAEYSRLDCIQFTLSVTLAFFTWLLQAASSFSGFWLLVSFF
ncbi:unnamed protein product [Triticum turgidum subsp. durum]|uniref:CASP-like protein n=1 Tax=Triticum turgidum subsp. durum TaxID=4567 RepID=A0A9R1AE89_TRITD|nr:unnamed protein product [Triticum turgidum subsp. durum]